jgi:hypothetical protein
MSAVEREMSGDGVERVCSVEFAASVALGHGIKKALFVAKFEVASAVVV